MVVTVRVAWMKKKFELSWWVGRTKMIKGLKEIEQGK